MSKETREPGPQGAFWSPHCTHSPAPWARTAAEQQRCRVARRQLQVDAEPEGRRQCGPAESTGDTTARAAAGSTHGGVGTATEVGTVGVHTTWP